MSEYEDRTMKAIEALLAVAESNFPSETDIRIEAIGKNTASIRMPAYVLRKMIKMKPDEHKCPYYPGCQPEACTRCWEHDPRPAPRVSARCGETR